MATRKNKVNTESVKAKQQEEFLYKTTELSEAITDFINEGGVSKVVIQESFDPYKFAVILRMLSENHYKVRRVSLEPLGVISHFIMSYEDFSVYMEGEARITKMYTPFFDASYRGIPMIYSNQLKSGEIFCTLKL